MQKITSVNFFKFLGSCISNNIGSHAGGNFLFDAIESTSGYKQHILGVDLNHALLGMLAATLWRYIHNSAFEQFKHGLLNTLARNIAGNARIVAFACYFVNFVNKNYTSFGGSYIVISSLQKPGKDTFHIFAHITCFGKNRGISNAEGYMQQFGNGTGKQGFACAGFTYENDVRFFYFNIIAGGRLVDSFKMVIDCH